MSTQEPREIAFEDIKKGDDIEARWERDGVVHTRRGIAHTPSLHSRPEYWYTEAAGVIANNYDGDWKHFLHARPAPPSVKDLVQVLDTHEHDVVTYVAWCLEGCKCGLRFGSRLNDDDKWDLYRKHLAREILALFPKQEQ